MPKRIIRAVSAQFDDKDGKVVIARQGEVHDIPSDVVAELDEQQALVPEGWDSFEDFHSASIDAYRGGRGDVEANARALALAAEGRRGGVTDVSVPASGNPFIQTLRDDSPGVDETIALAEGDPEKAAQVLEAESAVSQGNPRKGVVEGLAKITEG